MNQDMLYMKIKKVLMIMKIEWNMLCEVFKEESNVCLNSLTKSDYNFMYFNRIVLKKTTFSQVLEFVYKSI